MPEPHMIEQQIAAFRQSLTETIAWCRLRAALVERAASLRTAALRPPMDLFDLDHKCAERQAQVAGVVAARAQLLHNEACSPTTAAADLASRRLLLFAPDETLSDGAADLAAHGYFDSDNVPPWDTWVLYVEDEPSARDLELGAGPRPYQPREGSLRRAKPLFCQSRQ